MPSGAYGTAEESSDARDGKHRGVVLAVGRADPDTELPGHLAAREAAPRSRRPLGDVLLPAAPAGYLNAA